MSSSSPLPVVGGREAPAVANALRVAEIAAWEEARRSPLRPKCQEMEDVLQRVRLAAVRALELFEPTRGLCLSTYLFAACRLTARRALHEAQYPSRRDSNRAARSYRLRGEVPIQERPETSLDTLLETWHGGEGDADQAVDVLELANVWQQPEGGTEVERAALARLETAQVAAAVAELPPRYQEAVRLHFWENCSAAEIARRQGGTRQAAHYRLQSALRWLRPRLEASADEG